MTWHTRGLRIWWMTSFRRYCKRKTILTFEPLNISPPPTYEGHKISQSVRSKNSSNSFYLSHSFFIFSGACKKLEVHKTTIFQVIARRGGTETKRTKFPSAAFATPRVNQFFAADKSDSFHRLREKSAKNAEGMSRREVLWTTRLREEKKRGTWQEKRSRTWTSVGLI